MALQESMIPEESLMTAGAFEASYAALVGATVEQLHATGRTAEPCCSDWDRCLGWVLGHRRSNMESASQPIGLPE